MIRLGVRKIGVDIDESIRNLPFLVFLNLWLQPASPVENATETTDSFSFNPTHFFSTYPAAGSSSDRSPTVVTTSASRAREAAT